MQFHRLLSLLALTATFTHAHIVKRASTTRPLAGRPTRTADNEPPRKPTNIPQPFIPEFKEINIPGNIIPGLDRSTDSVAEDRRVVYYVDKQTGQAITQGDISLGPESNLISIAEKLNKRDLSALELDRRSLSIFPEWNDQKWPDALFRWKFNDENAATKLQYQMGEAIKLWKQAAPFLRFRQLPTSSTEIPGVLTVVVTEGQPACWAPIGYNAVWPMVISLDTACWISATVHEIGHALGLHHEHQRPDRDEHMMLNCSALADYSTYGGPETSCPGNPEGCCTDTACWGWACSFIHITYLDSRGPIDSLSVMHYREDAFANYALWPYHKTLIGKGSYVVPRWDNERPSEIDGTRMCEIYFVECERGPIPDPICGNGILEDGEECDDGNTNPGDGCSPTCFKELPPGVCTTCSPNPLQNKCDITTSCISLTPGGKTFCACRAGFKASSGDTARQWRMRFVGQEYRVFVEPGVACNTLCDQWDQGPQSCSEVPIVDQC